MTEGLWALLGSLSAEWSVTGFRGALLLTAAGMASLLLGRAPAALRHLVWVGASAGLLLLPFAAEVAPRWGVPLPWAVGASVAAVPGDAVAVVTGGPTAEDVGPAAAAGGSAAAVAGGSAAVVAGAPKAAAGGSTVPAVAGAPTTAAAGGSGAGAPRALVAAGGSDAGGASPAPEASGPEASATSGADVWGAGGAGVFRILFFVWALGALALLGSLARSLIAVRRLERRAEPFPEGRVTREARLMGHLLGLPRPVVLLRGGSDAMPLSWGIRRGRVLLPEGAERWHPERLRAVLLHELAHVRRRDCLAQVVAEVARAIHWLDPLAWVAVRRLRIEREHACDDRVLAAGAAPSVYATELLSLARGFRTRPALARAAVAMAGVSSLESRLRAVLDERRRRTFSRARAVAVTSIVAGLTILLAGATPGLAHGGTGSAAVSDGHPVPPVDERGRGDGSAGTPLPAPTPEPDAARSATWADDEGPAASVGEARSAERVHLARDPQEVTCGLEPDGWNSHSHHIDNDDHRLSWSKRGCTVDVRVEGEVEFSPDFRDVARLGRGARIRIEEEEGRTERVLEITPGAGGQPEYAYEVDGEARPFEGAARAWYEAMLLEVFRKGGFMAAERVEALLASGGPQAVMDELELISSDHVYARYVEELLLRADLDDDEALGLIDAARSRVDSDHYLAGMLEALAARDPMSDRVLTGLIEASESLESDHYRSGVLGRALERGDLTIEHRRALLRSAGGMDSDHYTASVLESLGERYALDPAMRSDYLATVATLESDHYRSAVLSTLMQRNDLAAGEIAVVLRALGGMESDHYVQSVLERVAGAGLDAPEIRDAYFDVAATIESDHYRSAALSALLENGSTSDDLLRRVIDAVGAMESDHYAAELLVRIARNHRLQGATREAYLRAMDTIESSHSRGQAADALLRSERGGA